MRCPECDVWAIVLETRHRKTKNATARRYECANGHRFSTVEQVAKFKSSEQKPDQSTHMKKD